MKKFNKKNKQIIWYLKNMALKKILEKNLMKLKN